MQTAKLALSVEQMERAIESKRALLAYLRSKPKALTMESHLCLTEILSKAGWGYKNGEWQKAEVSLPILAAADHELERQIISDKDRLLRQTVGTYRSASKER